MLNTRLSRGLLASTRMSARTSALAHPTTMRFLSTEPAKEQSDKEQSSNSKGEEDARDRAQESPSRAGAGQSHLPLILAGLALGGGALFWLTGQSSSPSSDSSSAASVDWDAARKELVALIGSAPEDYDDGSYGPLFVRLAWHASGTYDQRTGLGGSDGALQRMEPESTWGANAGLDLARELVGKVREQHPGASLADLYTLAGAVAVEELGGPHIDWQPGRRDFANNERSPKAENLPDAAQGADHLRDVFTTRMGFSDREIVALSGAHALGRCHANRSGFVGPWTESPTMLSNDYFAKLFDTRWIEKTLPSGIKQYRDPRDTLMMLPTDLVLRDDPQFRVWAKKYAEDEELFFKDFKAAFERLLELGVNRSA